LTIASLDDPSLVTASSYFPHRLDFGPDRFREITPVEARNLLRAGGRSDAFVAQADCGFIALHHQWLVRAGKEHIEQRAKVFVIGLDTEHTNAAIAEQRRRRRERIR
jgi:hypothetical protein